LYNREGFIIGIVCVVSYHEVSRKIRSFHTQMADLYPKLIILKVKDSTHFTAVMCKGRKK
jgi:hypothetical protein